jgi:hypothetical protein
LKSVVLPAPFGPIRPTIWPDCTSKETPSSATIPPNRTVRSRTDSTGRPAGADLARSGIPPVTESTTP